MRSRTSLHPARSSLARLRRACTRALTAIAQDIVTDGLLRSFEGGRRSTPHPSGSMRQPRSASFEQFRLKVLAIPTVEDREA